MMDLKLKELSEDVRIVIVNHYKSGLTEKNIRNY